MPKSQGVFWSVDEPTPHRAEAAIELEEAAVWYEERKRGLGGEFLRAVDHTIAFISRFPEGGTRVPDLSAELQVRRARVQRFPFHVVYLDRMMATR